MLRFGAPGGPVAVTAAQLGGGLVFLATSDRDVVAAFAETTLGWLVDDPAMGDLLTTLVVFFDNVASIRRCAACLDVHENTIRYRLGRIEELSGLAVAHDPDAQLQARLGAARPAAGGPRPQRARRRPRAGDAALRTLKAVGALAP